VGASAATAVRSASIGCAPRLDAVIVTAPVCPFTDDTAPEPPPDVGVVSTVQMSEDWL
jgi:hypothetical protein